MDPIPGPLDNGQIPGRSRETLDGWQVYVCILCNTLARYIYALKQR